MPQKLYRLKQVEHLINRFSQMDGNTYTEIYEGVLGYGKVVLKAIGKKTIVIKEVPVSEWSSLHSIRAYNICPKKYENY